MLMASQGMVNIPMLNTSP